MKNLQTKAVRSRPRVLDDDHKPWSVAQSAQYLGVGLTKMRALIASGEIASFQIGRLRKIEAAELKQYVLRLSHKADQNK